MKKVLLVVMLFQASLFSFAQERTQVFLLGTYHFGGNTPDRHKVGNDAILTKDKQGELHELLSKLEKFSPQRIYVENETHRQQHWDKLYKEHQKGKDLQIENEIYQVGVKLAGRLKLQEGITCVDWQVTPTKTVPEEQYLELVEKIADYHEKNYVPTEEESSILSKQIMQEQVDLNNRIPQMHLVDVFKHFNSEDYISKSFYSNRLSMLESDALGLMAFWSQNMMARDIKIYQNIIQDIQKNKPQRVLILYGAGHIKVLKDFFKAHPLIEIVDASQYL
jgi:hypothetical protein